MSIVEIFFKGGAVMYLLLLSSITVAAIGIERFRFYRYARGKGESFLVKLRGRFTKDNANTLLEFCKRENSSIGLVAQSGLEAVIRGENVELVLALTHDEEAMKLRARLSYLSMIVTLAPLLGLLGTIAGMIESFNIFALQAGQPLLITGGIGEALIATATGLCVAIFALIVHTYFAQKLDEILTMLDKVMAIVTVGIASRTSSGS